ncbi:MAG: DUF2807 domain-containing protein [Thermomicrobiales bacterium]
MNPNAERNLKQHIHAMVSRRAALPRLGGGIAGVAVVGVGLGATRAQTTDDTGATEATVRQTIEAINAILAGGDVAALDPLLATTYVNHTPHRRPSDGTTYSPDLAGLKSALTDLRSATRGPVLVVEEIIANGDSAAARLTFRGTAGVTNADSGEQTDYPVTASGVVIVHVKDGLVSESWDYDDFAEQFGIAAPAETTANQPVATEGGQQIEIADVNAVQVEGIGTLRVTQGDTESLVIKAEPKALRKIETDVRDGVLSIRPARSLRTREPIVYELQIIDLGAIDLSGAVEAEIAALKTTSLRLSLSGSSTATIDNLEVESLDVNASGNSTLSLVGTTTAQSVVLSGSGRYLAGDLASANATVNVSGAGQATIQVSDTLDVQIAGAGSVVYRGDPEITQQISGVGSLTQAK